MIFIPNRLYAEQSFSFAVGAIIYEANIKNKWQKITEKFQVFFILCGLIIGLFALAFKQINIVAEENYVLYNIEQLLIKLPIAVSLFFGIAILIKYRSGWIILKGLRCLAPITFEIYLVHVYVLHFLKIYNLSNLTYLIAFSTLCIAGVLLLKVVEYIINMIGRKLLYEKNSST